MEDYDYTLPGWGRYKYKDISRTPLEELLRDVPQSEDDSLDEFLKKAEETKEERDEQIASRKQNNMEILCYLEDLVSKFPHLTFGSIICQFIPSLSGYQESSVTLEYLRENYEKRVSILDKFEKKRD